MAFIRFIKMNISTPLSSQDQLNLAEWHISAFEKSKLIMADDLDILFAFNYPIRANPSTARNTIVAGGVADFLGMLTAARYNSYIGLGASAMPVVGKYAYRGYSVYRMANVKKTTMQLLTILQQSYILDLNIARYYKYRSCKLRNLKSTSTVQVIEEADMVFYKLVKENLALIVSNIQEALKIILNDIPALEFYYRDIIFYDIDSLFELESTIDQYLESTKNLHDLYCLVASAFVTSCGIAIKIFADDDKFYSYVDEIIPTLYKKVDYLIQSSSNEFNQFRSQTDTDIVDLSMDSDVNTLSAPLASIGMHAKMITDVSTAVLKSDNNCLEEIKDVVALIKNELKIATDSLQQLEAMIEKSEKLETAARPASSDTESYNTAVAKSDELESLDREIFEATGESFFSVDTSSSYYTTEMEPESRDFKRIQSAVVSELKDKLRRINTAKGAVTEELPPPMPSDIRSIDIPSHIRESANFISLSDAVSAIARHMERSEETFEDSSSED